MFVFHVVFLQYMFCNQGKTLCSPCISIFPKNQFWNKYVLYQIATPYKSHSKFLINYQFLLIQYKSAITLVCL